MSRERLETEREKEESKILVKFHAEVIITCDLNLQHKVCKDTCMCYKKYRNQSISINSEII